MPKNMEIAWLFDFYGEMLTEKQRNVIELYYEDSLHSLTSLLVFVSLDLTC